MLDSGKYRCIRLKAARIFIAVIISLSVFAGCSGKDKVKPSEDSMLADRAVETAAKIEDAYEKKDSASLQELLEDGFFDEISRQLTFSRADVAFSTPRVIKISGDEVRVVMNWKSAWTIDGREVRNRGITTLVFRSDTLKLIRTEGDNPFRLPSVIF